MFYLFYLREDNDMKKDNDNKVRKPNINQIQESKYWMTTHQRKHNTENTPVQSPNSLIELEDKEHKNLEDQHPSARSLKFR